MHASSIILSILVATSAALPHLVRDREISLVPVSY